MGSYLPITIRAVKPNMLQNNVTQSLYCFDHDTQYTILYIGDLVDWNKLFPDNIDEHIVQTYVKYNNKTYLLLFINKDRGHIKDMCMFVNTSCKHEGDCSTYLYVYTGMEETEFFQLDIVSIPTAVLELSTFDNNKIYEAICILMSYSNENHGIIS